MPDKTGERRRSEGGAAVGRAVALVVVAGAYSWATAGTRPFSPGADAAVAAALVVAVGLAMAEAAAGRPWRAAHPDRTSPRGSLWPWWVAIAVLVGWELFNYFQSPRHSHPTFSSIYDHIARWQWAKALLVAAWLVLGWAIVASFAKEHRRAHDVREVQEEPRR